MNRDITPNPFETQLRSAALHLEMALRLIEQEPLLDVAGVKPDAGIVDLPKGAKVFIGPASTRQWDREDKVRILA